MKSIINRFAAYRLYCGSEDVEEYEDGTCVWIEMLDFYKPIIKSRSRVSEMAKEAKSTDLDVAYDEVYTIDHSGLK